MPSRYVQVALTYTNPVYAGRPAVFRTRRAKLKPAAEAA